MSTPAAHNFGPVLGIVGKDLRIVVGGKGRKNLLAVVAGYSRVNFAAHDAATFYGRLTVLQGTLPDEPDVDVLTTLLGAPKVLFDIMLKDLGPHTFFFPLAQLEGNTQTDEDATLTIVLAAAQDNTGKNFVGRLNTSGKTVFGGVLSAQTGTP